MVLGAYSSAPNLKTTKALPPPPRPQDLRSKPNTKTTDLTQPEKQLFGGAKTQIITVAQIEISDYYNTQKGKLK